MVCTDLNVATAAGIADRFVSRLPSYPDIFEGRGIVICGGGIKYGACAWVLVKLLRHLGCQLPIEVWSLNDEEFDPGWIALVEPLGVRCVNAQEVLPHHPHRRLRGWELKPYSIQHSRFQEVLFLDADNVPIVDPTFLFESDEYRQTGTLFWPDPESFLTLQDSPLWQIFGLPYRESPDQESGQLLIDKKRCWQSLTLCNWYNEHSDFYYKHVYGDKETFRFAWQRLEQPISWMPHPSDKLHFTLLHYDAAKRSLFQHRFYRKWSLYGANTSILGFEHENLCLKFLDQLRAAWHPQKHLMRHVTAADRTLMASLAGRRFLYDRPGHNRWPIHLGSDGFIEEGYGPNEFFWWCEESTLTFAGMDGQRKCQLHPVDSKDWRGECSVQRGMQIHLRSLSA